MKLSNSRTYKAIPILILLISGGMVVSGRKFFPFSNYPMFMHTQKSPNIYTLVVNYEDGSREFVPRHIFYPFGKLHIHQMIRSTLWSENKSEDRFSWVEFFIKRLMKDQKNIESVTVEHVEFMDIYARDWSLKNCRTKTIHTFNLEGL